MNQQKVQVVDADFAGIFFKPIAHYLSDPNTSEVMVNAPDDIWIEGSGKLFKAPEHFTPDSLEAAVNSLAQYVGRPIIENVFSIDARMPDGSRVCIVLPPVSGKSPIFSIRIFKGVITDLNYLVKQGSMTKEMVTLLGALVQVKENMMVAGGTSSGKTTLLNLLASTIPNEERILTIEDSRELQLKQEHVLALEARPADKHGKGEFTIRQCLKSSLRLRPDRIVVGEIRGGEAFDLLMAMNTGHGGCMGTVHANTPTDTLRRIESLALMADVDMPLVAIRAIIASTLNVIVSPARLSDGSRRIINISEVGPLTEKGDYQTFDMVRYVTTSRDEQTGKLSGYFEFTGYVPSFFDHFAAEGVKVPRDFFRKRIIGNVNAEIAEEKYQEGCEIYNLDGETYRSPNPRRVVDAFKVIPSQPPPQQQNQPYQEPIQYSAGISGSAHPEDPDERALGQASSKVTMNPSGKAVGPSVPPPEVSQVPPPPATAEDMAEKKATDEQADLKVKTGPSPIKFDSAQPTSQVPEIKNLVNPDTSDLHEAFERFSSDGLSPIEKLGTPVQKFEDDGLEDEIESVSALGKMFQPALPSVPETRVSAIGNNPYQIDDEVSALRSEFEEFQGPPIDPELQTPQMVEQDQASPANQDMTADRPNLLNRLRHIATDDHPSEPATQVSSPSMPSDDGLSQPMVAKSENLSQQSVDRSAERYESEASGSPSVQAAPQASQPVAVPAGDIGENSEAESAGGGQHVVIAEILRRMRENRAK